MPPVVDALKLLRISLLEVCVTEALVFAVPRHLVDAPGIWRARVMQFGKYCLTVILVLVSVRTSAVPASSVAQNVPESSVLQLDGPGSTYTDASGLNNRGEIVGTFEDAHGLHGYVFRGGAFTTLDVPVPGALTIGIGINDRGQVAGAYRSAGSFHGFLWDRGRFTDIDAPDADETFLHGINNRGQIVGHSRRDVHSLARAFLWVDGVFTFLDIPGVLIAGRTSDSLGINDRGQIVGTYQSRGVDHGFLLDDGVITQIDIPGAIATSASGINNRGQIVGGYLDASFVRRAYLRHTDGSVSLIEAPRAEGISAVRLNDRADVVGMFSETGGRFHGFLWSR